jgi:hypothetical protein
MMVLRETPEVFGVDLQHEREVLITKTGPGLGPDDLVCLTRQEATLFFRTRIISGWHHISGLAISSTAIFAAYDADLVKHHVHGLAMANILRFKNWQQNFWELRRWSAKLYKISKQSVEL